MPFVPDALFQELIDASYRLAVTVHLEDVPEIGAETVVVEALRRVKMEIGEEPTDYVLWGDVHSLMGSPPNEPRPLPAHTPNQKIYYELTHTKLNDLMHSHLGVRDYNCAEAAAWNSDHIEFITVDMKKYLPADREMLSQALADPSAVLLPLSLVMCELADRSVLPEGEYMIWVV